MWKNERPHLLFVCTANLCRSPMAAALADRVALELGVEPEIRSAGTRAIPGRPAVPGVIAVCREIGLDLGGHQSQPVTEELVRWADRIFVMEREHAVFVRGLVEDLAEDAIVALDADQVDDPIRSWLGLVTWRHYRRTRDQLLASLKQKLPLLHL